MTAADVSVLVDGKEQSNFGKVQVRFDENGAVIIDEHLQGVLEEFNVPVTVTPRVQHYLTYFTGKGRPIMQNWLNRSHRYMYLVKDIFQNEGAPLDLIALAFTESGFNPWAYSRAGAAGIWQFMRGTGKMYGLEVNDWVDERRDFEKATLAAAQHLNDLYEIFNDWYLALAAYNAGAGKITRATKAHGTTDFFEIASGRTLKPETRDYVPKYLAHLLIFNNLKEYGFKSPNDEILPLQFDSLELDSQVNIFVIAEILGCSPEELKDLNPALRTPMTPPVKKYTLRVPYGMKETATAFIQDNSSDLTRYIIYQAKTGDDLSKIAKMHNVSLEEIKKLNNFNYDTIYTSKIFFIPKSGIVLNEYDIAFAKEIATLAPKYYIVRKGDNFNRISRQHNIPLYTLVQLNPKVNPKRIYPGQVLIVSQGGLTS
ncbi:MAG: transglycosylase SLT domain-containing protein [Deferribacteraceae bacterium]|nr:transglycosylase SLT domain-containing protein [Deferribacteraceae bacterium]